MKQTRQIDGGRPAADDRNAIADNRRKIVMIIAVRNKLWGKPAQRSWQITEVADANCDHNATRADESARYLASPTRRAFLPALKRSGPEKRRHIQQKSATGREGARRHKGSSALHRSAREDNRHLSQRYSMQSRRILEPCPQAYDSARCPSDDRRYDNRRQLSASERQAKDRTGQPQ